MKTFFTSDLHFNHSRILTYCKRLEFMNDVELKNIREAEKRGATSEEFRQLRYSFETIEKMNSGIIDNINKIVGENDELWNLGDVFFGGDIEKLRRLRQRIICKNFNLLFGNHDKEIKRMWDEGDLRDVFKTAQHVAFIGINGINIWASHYAHITWNGSRSGRSYHLFGHSHSGLNEWLDEHAPNSLMMDVGIDNAFKILKEYRPFSFDEIKKCMKSKKT